MLKMLLGAIIFLSVHVSRAQTAPAAAAGVSPTAATSVSAAPTAAPVTTGAPTTASEAASPAGPGAPTAPAPAPTTPAPQLAPLANANDVQRLQNEYLETKNAGFSKWRDGDVTAVGALLEAIASRFADALAHRQSLVVTGLATRTNIPGWGKPMEVSARSFVELSEGATPKIVCKLDTNLGYFFFPAMVNVECLWLTSSERLQLSGLATSSQPVSSADPSSLGGIDLNKLELRFPDDPKTDRLQ